MSRKETPRFKTLKQVGVIILLRDFLKILLFPFFQGFIYNFAPRFECQDFRFRISRVKTQSR